MPDKDGTGPRGAGKRRMRNKTTNCREKKAANGQLEKGRRTSGFERQIQNPASEGVSLKSIGRALAGFLPLLLPVISKIDKLLEQSEKKQLNHEANVVEIKPTESLSPEQENGEETAEETADNSAKRLE